MNNSLAAGYLQLGRLCRTNNRRYFEKSLSQIPFPIILEILTKGSSSTNLDLTSDQKWFLNVIVSKYHLLSKTFVVSLPICTVQNVPTKIKTNNISPQNPISFTVVIQDIGYDVNIIGQLGVPGAQGVTYLIEQDLGGGIIIRRAMKVFKKGKSIANVQKEAATQQKAGIAGISPQIYGYSDGGIKLHHKGPFILMDLVPGVTFPKLAAQMNGKLTTDQQYNLLNVTLDMDDIKLRHNDPNPLNVMYVYETGQFVYIDFGLARIFKDTDNPYTNFSALNTMLHGGMQGLATRGLLKPGGYDILEFWLTKYKNAGNMLTPEDIVFIRKSRAPICNTN